MTTNSEPKTPWQRTEGTGRWAPNARDRLVLLIADNPGRNASVIVEGLGLPITMTRYIRELEKGEFIVYGGRVNPGWFLTSKGDVRVAEIRANTQRAIAVDGKTA